MQPDDIAPRLARVLDRFPRLVVVAAHLGGYRMWDLFRITGSIFSLTILTALLF